MRTAMHWGAGRTAGPPRWLPSMGILVLLAWSTRFVVVYTPSASLPKGWYLRVWTVGEIGVGDLVVAETPPHLRRLLPPGFPHAGLLKQIAAVGGMEVCWTPDAMQVHTAAGTQRYWKHPAITRRDEPDHCEVLTSAVVVLVGTHPRSMDGRYLGPILRAYIRFRVVPLWTWGGD
jgi:type IV secretory pathway protease TraF